MYFEYGAAETEYLKGKDTALEKIIDQIGPVASLYLWAVAGGAIPDLKDYAPKRKRRDV